MQRPDGRWTWRYDPLLAANDPGRQVRSTEQWATVERITCPTLVLRGEQSTIRSRGTADRMVQSIRRGRLRERPDFGHGTNSGNLPAFHRAVQDFLAEWVPVPPSSASGATSAQ